MFFVYGFIVAIVIFIIFGAIGRKSTPAPPENLTDDDICDIALQGNKIQAIKWYRSLHNVGLKDAKDAVEAMIQKAEEE